MAGRLTPSAAYRLGYRRAKAQMRRELDEMARRLHDEVSEIAAEMTRRLRAEIIELTDEVRAARGELHRNQCQSAEINELRDQLAAATGELLRDRYLRALEVAEQERVMFPDLSLH